MKEKQAESCVNDIDFDGGFFKDVTKAINNKPKKENDVNKGKDLPLNTEAEFESIRDILCDKELKNKT